MSLTMRWKPKGLTVHIDASVCTLDGWDTDRVQSVKVKLFAGESGVSCFGSQLDGRSIEESVWTVFGPVKLDFKRQLLEPA